MTETKMVQASNGVADITSWAASHAAGTKEGLCLVTALSPQVGILVTDGDPRAVEDLLEDMERLFPGRSSYTAATPPQETAAAVKSAVCGAAKVLPVERGRLVLGINQRLLAVSYCGGGECELAVTII